MTFCVFSINLGITIVLVKDEKAIPGQIYFGLTLIAQIGEMTSCPIYVIIYCFNREKFKELLKILCCRKGESETNTKISLFEIDGAIIKLSNTFFISFKYLNLE